ncbi:MAG TPA: hypothetical protein VF156_15535 [Agromyces sp.]
MTTSTNNRGEEIAFADRPEYVGVFAEPQNADQIAAVRHRLLEQRLATNLVLQPGDGTKYKFLLVPDPDQFVISDHGRQPEVRSGVSGQLYVHVLHGLGRGVMLIAAHNGLDGIRYRIAEYLEIGNPCTREALARTLYYCWSECDE